MGINKIGKSILHSFAVMNNPQSKLSDHKRLIGCMRKNSVNGEIIIILCFKLLNFSLNLPSLKKRRKSKPMSIVLIDVDKGIKAPINIKI